MIRLQLLKLCVFLVIILSGISTLSAQSTKSREELEREKTEIQKRLQEFDQILKRTTETKKTSLGQLNVVTKQLQVRITYIRNLTSEIKTIEKEINETQKKIRTLEGQLVQLKEEYAKMVYTTSKFRGGLTMTAFIFSSNNFRQLYMRLKYLKQYSDARKKQVEQLEKVSTELDFQRGKLEKKKVEKQEVINQEERQKKELDQTKKEQEKIVKELTIQEQDLRRKIASAKKQQENLNRMIKQIIEQEIKKAEAEAKQKNSTSTKPAGSSMPMTPEAAALSNSFAGNKGRLPWPVESGFVSKKFGSHPHPTLKGITEENDGIDIQTQPNANVRTVFDGEVTKIFTVPGYGGTVVIKHGEYYTMYSKLKVVSVKTGESVKAKQTLGQVYTNKEGVAEVHFQTWKGLTPMNPSTWLSGR
jgi:murein hydrolase activator